MLRVYMCFTGVRSIVPMIHLSWSLAKKVKIVDEALYLQLRYV